jgi:hypothetical protein
MCKKTIREKLLEQIDLVEELQYIAKINIVNCGNCGSVLLHKIVPLKMDRPAEDYDITCPYCDFTSEPCDFPDFLYRGMEHSLIMDIVLTTLKENDTLSIDQAKSVEDAINNGYIDTCDIFDDFVGYVSVNDAISYDTLMDYQEHYQNLLSHKENLKIIQESFGSSEKSTIFTENLKPISMKTVDYAQMQVKITAQENGIQSVDVVDGKLFIEFPSGKTYELSNEEVKYQAEEYLKSELEMIKSN